jgi:hypothetical protein
VSSKNPDSGLFGCPFCLRSLLLRCCTAQRLNRCIHSILLLMEVAISPLSIHACAAHRSLTPAE